MAGAIWVVGEATDSGLARISGEAATLARRLGAQSGREVVGVVVGVSPGPAAAELATYVPRVIALEDASAADRAWSTPAASRLAVLVEGDGPGFVLVGATPDGRDLAGALSALLGWGVLGNATDVAWSADGPTVEMSVFGGKLLTTSAFTADRGIVIVRPGSTTAEPADAAGAVEIRTTTERTTLPGVAVLERVAETGAAAPIEEAKVIVAGGRGVGGPEGFAMVEELARGLGGVVGASRAAVDAGWIPYARQIGQTGKVVKPALYVALGISGAIQHKVGMQTAGTIVAVNRDPDAPLAEFADLYVVGDLFEVVPAVLTELRARSG
jgi:electron transfer flavoprotein alpha subunit